MSNLYWSIYQGLERELIALSEKIHFDDEQVKVYSVKMVELIIRCVVEIESIVKELYIANNGKPANQNEYLYFDTDCINYLDSLWCLHKKKVLVSSLNFHFNRDENIVLRPFHKAAKRGTSSSNWQKAYQAVKHNRSANLSKGNISNLIAAMAALYLSNIYYRDTVYDMKNSHSGIDFDSSLGSLIFSTELHVNQTISSKPRYFKNDNFDECVYILLATEESRIPFVESMARDDDEVKKRVATRLIEKRKNNQLRTSTDEIGEDFDVILQDVRIEVINESFEEQQKILRNMRYNAVLNKSQI